MTLLVGHHVQEDSYAGPELGAVTFLDVGGGSVPARERLCRVYFTGRPEPAWLAGKIAEPPAAGWRNVVGNEPNLYEVEGFPGGPADYAAFFAAVADLAPAITPLYYAGMSPGVPGWESWYTDPAARRATEVATGLCVHAYGDLPQLQATVRFVVDQYPGKPLWIGEWNFGAGRHIPDLEAWAHETVWPFLDWCAAIPQIEAATWFSWWWNESVHLPTSVDARGTIIEELVRDWRPPINGGAVTPTDPTALRDRTYNLAEQLQALGPEWQSYGYAQHAEFMRTTGEAIKRTLAIGKGER